MMNIKHHLASTSLFNQEEGGGNKSLTTSLTLDKAETVACCGNN